MPSRSSSPSSSATQDHGIGKSQTSRAALRRRSVTTSHLDQSSWLQESAGVQSFADTNVENGGMPQPISITSGFSPVRSPREQKRRISIEPCMDQPQQGATAQFRSAAKRLALIPLPPNVPRKADSHTESQIQCSNATAGKSPRKLLWPTTQTSKPGTDDISTISHDTPDTRPENPTYPQTRSLAALNLHTIKCSVESQVPYSSTTANLCQKQNTGHICCLGSPSRVNNAAANTPRQPQAPPNFSRTFMQSNSIRNGKTRAHAEPISTNGAISQENGEVIAPIERHDDLVPQHEDPVKTMHDEPPFLDATTLRQRQQDPDMRFHRAHRLPEWQVWLCRVMFGIFVLGANVSLLLAYLHTNRHLYLLAILAFMKSKDLISTVVDILGLTFLSVHKLLYPPKEIPQKWILSLVCAFAETDEQIMKTVRSLVVQEVVPHRQIICIVLDGTNPDLLTRFTRVVQKMKRPYYTWKGTHSELTIYTAFINMVPIILIRKSLNAGKKDSLILGHDLFNYPRADMPYASRKLRREIFKHMIPALVGDAHHIESFDYVFCTDADSTIHKDALRKLVDALSRCDLSIAACGVLVAELAVPGLEWSYWHLYQQFQYTFGQYVRRQAEGIWGRVTCLPGCITMIKVRPETGSAISLYAQPVSSHYNLFEHQVQYLGTDRRLTYCLLSQGKHLKSLFVSDALCETVVPESMEHYLSQRRRWASNAYFNDYYYAGGKSQLYITRLFAVIDIIRQTLVFYRVINTALFIRSLALRFYVIKIVPTLIVTKTPAVWFMLVALAREPVLRRRLHKLILGMCINQFFSPILSVIVFANVILNMGSQVWGKTGASSLEQPRTPKLYAAPVTPNRGWSPGRLETIIRTAVKGQGPADSKSPTTSANRSRWRRDTSHRANTRLVLQTPNASAAVVSTHSPDVRFRTIQERRDASMQT